MGAPEPSGRVVGRYAVFDEIAAGGTGERPLRRRSKKMLTLGIFVAIAGGLAVAGAITWTRLHH